MINFGKINLLIVDEAYLVILENILKLKCKKRENPQIKVVFFGWRGPVRTDRETK